MISFEPARARAIATIVDDLRQAVRQLRRQWAFASTIVLTLGLGIGATVALFTVVDQLLLRPLPYPDADRIHVFWMDQNWRGDEYDFVRERAGVFEHVAAFNTDDAPYHPSARGASRAELLRFAVITPTLFDVLATRPLLGRAFDTDDARPGAPPVIVVSYGVWQQDLGGDPAIIGRQIRLSDQPTTVVGVMPPRFFFPTPDIRAWTPLRLDPTTAFYHNVGYLTLLGRARDGASNTAIQADARRIARALGAQFTYPDAWDKTRNAHATPIRTYLVGDVRESLLLLFGAGTLVLLIACANAAALILARTSDRAGEMALRSALGADRWRLARTIFAESLVLALGAAVVGGTIATVGFRVLVARLPFSHGLGDTLSTGWAALILAFALALGIAAVVSIVPARGVLRGRLEHALQRERGSAGLRQGTRRMHELSVAAQVTLAVMLVLGATLLIRSVDRLRALDLGFDPRGIVTFTLVAGDETTVASRDRFFHELVARVAALPAVTAAGLTNRLPVRDGGYETMLSLEDRPELRDTKRPSALYRTASAAYFRAMGMRMREGRAIDSTDVATSLPVAVIDDALARRFWPGESALGKRLGTAYSGTMVWRTVVGVVREPRMTSVTGQVPLTMFVPFDQHPATEQAVLIVRGGAPEQLLSPVRRTIAGLDPEIAIARTETMDQTLAGSLAQPLRLRFFLTLFATLSVALGSIGVYAVVAYAVGRRRAEFAVRMALGASPARVRREVLARALAPVSAGAGAGLVAALALARVLRGLLFGVGPADPASIVVAIAALLGASVLAALLPALRAARTSPSEALRSP